MSAGATLLTLAFLLIVAGPLLLAVLGLKRAPRAPAAPVRWNWSLVIASTLLCTLAYNLIFFVQELFLVVPKAFLPGVHPTLYHNNHGWQGAHPLTSLFQGTGALATLLTGAASAFVLRFVPERSPLTRLFLLWMVYNGVLQALPQFIAGALIPGNDVGMAMTYLQMPPPARWAAGLLALALIPVTALWVGKRLLQFAPAAARESARGRTRFILQIATVPLLASIVLILPFRIPREAIEVVAPPVLVALFGLWMPAGAWRFDSTGQQVTIAPGSLAWLFAAVGALLLVFQLVLRPGIDF